MFILLEPQLYQPANCPHAGRGDWLKEQEMNYIFAVMDITWAVASRDFLDGAFGEASSGTCGKEIPRCYQ
ncbi:MAG: hypothetical protein ACYC2T_09555 [Bacillota bacterium]